MGIFLMCWGDFLMRTEKKRTVW